MNRVSLTVIILFVFFVLNIEGSDCYAKEESALFWPPPPAEMRVAFVESVYSPNDVGMELGFFNKLKRIISGEVKDRLNKPMAVAVDAQKTIYICDSGNHAVHIFMQKEKRYKKITTIDNKKLLSPVGVAVSDNGRAFICDSNLKNVFCIDKEGRFKFAIGKDKGFLRPTGVAIGNGRLYVVDTAAHSISIFDLAGNLVSQFGSRGRGEGEFNCPTSITVDNEGKIYVVDTLNFRIQVFDENNKFLWTIGEPGDSSGSFSRPKGVAVDSFRHIYVTDGIFDNVQIFSQKKEFLLSLGEAGHKDGEFWIPCGLAIDRDNYIYVADSYNQRIQIFRYVGKE